MAVNDMFESSATMCKSWTISDILEEQSHWLNLDIFFVATVQLNQSSLMLIASLEGNPLHL